MRKPKVQSATPRTRTFEENLADVGADDARERDELERAQKALDERREKKWRKARREQSLMPVEERALD